VTRVCRGCGALLQHTDKNLPGYTPKEDSDYCQRCFRLIHYADPVFSMREGIDPDAVLARVEAMDAAVVWVVDLFDFEAGMIPGLARRLTGKDIILVCTKRDLLPADIKEEKLARFVLERMKDYGVSVRRLIFSAMDRPECVEEVREAIRTYADGGRVVVLGKANSGKSTLLNRLIGTDILTSSRWPGTTLDFNDIEIDGIVCTDTPGIEVRGSMINAVDEKDLKTILPSWTVKPQVYQLSSDQCFSIGGLAQVYLLGCEGASAVFWLSGRLKLHRTKAENGERIWKEHLGKDFVPVPAVREFSSRNHALHGEKTDIVMEGLGWVCVSGKVSSVRVKAPKGVNVTFRRAMI